MKHISIYKYVKNDPHRIYYNYWWKFNLKPGEGYCMFKEGELIDSYTNKSKKTIKCSMGYSWYGSEIYLEVDKVYRIKTYYGYSNWEIYFSKNCIKISEFWQSKLVFSSFLNLSVSYRCTNSSKNIDYTLT